MFPRESKEYERALHEQAPSPEHLTGVFPEEEEEVEMEEQNQHTQGTSDSMVAGEAHAEALCGEGEVKGISTTCAARDKFVAAPEINVVDEDDDEDLQLALALSASLAESNTVRIPTVSNSYETRENSEKLRPPLQGSGKGEESQKQDVLLVDVSGSPRNSSSSSVDTHGSVERSGGGSTSASSRDATGIRRSSTRSSKNSRKASNTNEAMCSKLKERRLSATDHNASTNSSSHAESGLSRVKTLTKDSSRSGFHDSFDSSSSRSHGTGGSHAMGSSLASSSGSAAYEGSVLPPCGFVPYPGKETSRKGVIFKENADLLREETQKEQIPFYRLPCSASTVRTPNWLVSSSSIVGQREILGSNDDDDDMLCRNAFGERRRERRERRRGISSLDDDVDALEEEDDIEQVFSEERTKNGLLGPQDITGRRTGLEEQQIEPGSQYSIRYASPATTCSSTLLGPSMDAVITKRECAGSDSIVSSSSSSSSSSFVPGSSTRGSRMSHSGSTSSSTSSGTNRRRSIAGKGKHCSRHVAGQGSSFPSSAGGVCTEERYREGAEQEGEKRQSYEGGGFRLQQQQQQQPQHELQGLVARETDASFERKPAERKCGGCVSSRRRSASALLQQQHPRQQQSVSLEPTEQEQGAQQKPSLMSSFTPSDGAVVDVGKSVKLNEGEGNDTGAVERRRTERRKIRGKTADGAHGKRKRKRRRISTDEDTEEDEGDTVFKYEDESTVSDETETATVIPDDDDDDEETQLQVALAVSLSTADHEIHSSSHTGARVSTSSPRSSSSSSSRAAESGVAGDNTGNCRNTNRIGGSNRSCCSRSGNISGAGSAPNSSGRRGKRDSSGSTVDEGGYSCSPSTEGAQEILLLSKSRRVRRDGEQDDSCARMDDRSSDCQGPRKCEHCTSGGQRACSGKSRRVEGRAEGISRGIEGSDCQTEDEIIQSGLFEAAVSSADSPAGAGITSAPAVSTVDSEHAVSSHTAGSEAKMGSVCDAKRGSAPAVSVDSALEGSSQVEDSTIRIAQTAGTMSAARPRATAITERTAITQATGVTAYETGHPRAGGAAAGTMIAGTATARPPPGGSPGRIVVTRSTGQAAARAEADATSVQREEIVCSGDSEENSVNGDNVSDSDFEPETRGEWKKNRMRQPVQQRQGRKAHCGSAQRLEADSGQTSDSSSSNNESTSVQEEDEHHDTDDSEEDGRAKQTHRTVTRERHMQTQGQHQYQTRTYRQEQQQQRRKPQRMCKTSEDGKGNRQCGAAKRFDVQATLSTDIEERQQIAEEARVECQNDVDDAETAAADEKVRDNAETAFAESGSAVVKTRVTLSRLTSGLTGVSLPPPSTAKSSTVSAAATAAASRRGEGAAPVAEAEVREPSDSRDSEADSTQAVDVVHDETLKGRQRGCCASGRTILSKTKQEKEGKKPRRLTQQQRQNEKQELRCVSNAAATAAVKMWRHEKLHEVCLYVWAALTEAISIPSKSEAALRGDVQRSGGAERLIRGIGEQQRRQQQREEEKLEQLLQEQQPSRAGKRAEREAAEDRTVCERMLEEGPADGHSPLQQGIPPCVTSLQLNEPETLCQPQQQQQLPRRVQQDKQLSKAKQGQGQQQVQQLPPPRPFLTLDQLGKVAEAAGLASLTVDELMKMVATAAGAAGAASTAGQQQLQRRKHHAGQVTEKKGRNRKQHGYLSSDACSQHYSQALGRTTLSFEEFVSFFHYGLGLKVESNGKVW